MKVLLYQNKDRNLSINLLFDIIKKHFPRSLQFTTVYFTYNGASLKARVYDVISAAFKPRKNINHVIGDFNYATYFMPRSKTILTIHDLYRLYLNKGTGFKLSVLKFAWLQLPIYKSAVVTAVSECTKKEVLKFSNCPQEKVRVIYNCISPGFKPSPKTFNKLKPVLLQVGTRPNKNLRRVAAAIEGISCKLEIIGKINEETIALLQQLNIDYNWQFELTHEQVIQKYIDCDILVFVSTYEGFGLPIIEANAVERAVITGNISAMPEIAGDAACLVDPFDIAAIRKGVIKVIEDEAYRENLIAAGRINKQRFEAENIANQYYELYQEVYTQSKK